jgi:hypothetical protein
VEAIVMPGIPHDSKLEQFWRATRAAWQESEQALRPLAVGRRHWLQIAGDGGLKSAAVLLNLAATTKRHGLNPWTYIRHLLSAAGARQPEADFSDLLPDAWMQAQANNPPTPS